MAGKIKSLVLVGLLGLSLALSSGCAIVDWHPFGCGDNCCHDRCCYNHCCNDHCGDGPCCHDDCCDDCCLEDVPHRILHAPAALLGWALPPGNCAADGNDAPPNVAPRPRLFPVPTHPVFESPNMAMLHEARQRSAQSHSTPPRSAARRDVPNNFDSTAVAQNDKPPVFRRGTVDATPANQETSQTVQAHAEMAVPQKAQEQSVLKMRLVDRPAMIQAHGESGPPSSQSTTPIPSTASTSVAAPSDAFILEAAEPAVAGWQPVVRRR